MQRAPSPKPQSIYDDPVFFRGYEELRRTGKGLNDVLEQPALWSMLPGSLKGLRVLDLGCGFGDFAREARRQGAESVVGIDASARMLAKAAERTADSGIAYRHLDIEGLESIDGSFDLVVSSLALHYVRDYRTAVVRVAERLVSGGRFAFSVEHPICTARAEQRWIRDSAGKALYWPVDDYRSEGERRTRWFVDGVVKYHRTVETYVNGLIEAGFVLQGVREPAPPKNVASEAVPEVDLHRRRPPFLLLAAVLGRDATPA